MHVWQPGNLCERLTQRLFGAFDACSPLQHFKAELAGSPFVTHVPCSAEKLICLVIILLWRRTEMHWERSSAYDKLHHYSQMRCVPLQGTTTLWLRHMPMEGRVCRLLGVVQQPQRRSAWHMRGLKALTLQP